MAGPTRTRRPRPRRRHGDHGLVVGTKEVIDLIGWRRTVGVFLSGSVLAFIMSVAGVLVVFGGERRVVLDHVSTTEPLRLKAIEHFSNSEAHLDAAESNLLAVMPVKFIQVEKHLESLDAQYKEITNAVNEIRRNTRR